MTTISESTPPQLQRGEWVQLDCRNRAVLRAKSVHAAERTYTLPSLPGVEPGTFGLEVQHALHARGTPVAIRGKTHGEAKKRNSTG